MAVIWACQSLFNTGWLSGVGVVHVVDTALSSGVATKPWPRWGFWVYFEMFCLSLIVAPGVKWYWRLFAMRLRVVTGGAAALGILGIIALRHGQHWGLGLVVFSLLVVTAVRVVSWAYTCGSWSGPSAKRSSATSRDESDGAETEVILSDRARRPCVDWRTGSRRGFAVSSRLARGVARVAWRWLATTVVG